MDGERAPAVPLRGIPPTAGADDGIVRCGLMHYNTEHDVDCILRAIAEA